MPFFRTHASPAGRLVAAALLPILLASCAAERERQVAFSSWKQADPIPQAEVAQVPIVHEVRFAPADLQVSDIEREALYLFLVRNGVRTGDRVTVSVAIPNSAESTRAGNRLASVRAELIRQGVFPTILAPGSATVVPAPDRVLVTATKLAVLPIECPGYNTPIQLDYEHRPMLNPGCANATNLGLMVADPADLAQGRPLGPADGEGSTAAIQRYRAGAVYPTGQPQSDVPFRLDTESN
jgi:pilus assembly protein CpaD